VESEKRKIVLTIKTLKIMKKNMQYALCAMLALLTAASCVKKESEGLSRVTFYCNLELKGDNLMAVSVGEPFADPGYTATENDEDITSKVQVSGSVNTNECGISTLKYSVKNADGFPTSKTRTVFVTNPNSFASAYFGESQYGTRHYYNAPILINDNGDGTYTIDDIAGGFYFFGRYPGYEESGYDFHLETILRLSGNDVEIVSQDPDEWYWEEAITITSGTYDATQGKVTLTLDFGGTPMYVTLTKTSVQ
jgi:hypothetical protein